MAAEPQGPGQVGTKEEASIHILDGDSDIWGKALRWRDGADMNVDQESSGSEFESDEDHENVHEFAGETTASAKAKM
jgi:hypothetical protein